MIKDVSYTYNSDGTVEVKRTDVADSSKVDSFDYYMNSNIFDDPSKFPQIGSEDWDKFMDSLTNRVNNSYSSYLTTTTKLEPYVTTADDIRTGNINASYDNFNRYYVLYELIENEDISEVKILTVTPYESIAKDLNKKYGYLIREETIV